MLILLSRTVYVIVSDAHLSDFCVDLYMLSDQITKVSSVRSVRKGLIQLTQTDA